MSVKELCKLKHVGKAKAEALAKAGYSNLEKLSGASVEELAKVNGISKRLAALILNQVRKKKQPYLTAEERSLLRLRKAQKSRRPRYGRQEWFRYKDLGKRWRRPKGRHSKQRRKFKYRPKMPTIGYSSPRQVRGLHPSGYREIVVHNPSEVVQVKPTREAIRIAGSVGSRKREDIIKKADKLGVRVLNRE